MSQSHLEVPEPQPRRRVWLEITVGVITFLVLIAIAISRFQGDTFDTSHITTKGEVLETRIAVKGANNSMYGGGMLYQIEVRVRYAYQGKSMDRWMVASDIESREYLQRRLADSPKDCEVYWSESHPESPRCRFYAPSK